MDELEEGTNLLESIWFLLANTIVDLAIQTYQLDTQQAAALKEVFLKQNHYYVVLDS
jgi:hypothetical protein